MGKRKNPLKFVDGVAYGLFAMMDTYGFPLSDSILICEQTMVVPGLPAFACDAVLAGWKPEKAVSVVCDALRELGRPVDPRLRQGLRFATQDAARWCSKAMSSQESYDGYERKRIDPV